MQIKFRKQKSFKLFCGNLHVLLHLNFLDCEEVRREGRPTILVFSVQKQSRDAQFSIHNSINVLSFALFGNFGLLVVSAVKRTRDSSWRIAWKVGKHWLHSHAFKEWRQEILIHHVHAWLSSSPNLGDQSSSHP